MTRSRLMTAGLMLLLLIAVGFISLPAYSGEDPWDADGGEGTDADTSYVDVDTIDIIHSVRDGDGRDRYLDFLRSISCFFATKYSNWFYASAEAAQVEADRAKAAKRTRVRKYSRVLP